MQNEKRLFTEMIGVKSYMYSIRNACDVIRDFLNLADSTMFISSYIADGLDNCVKEMGTAVENIKRELKELNKDKDEPNSDPFENALDKAVREHVEGVRNDQ